VRSGENILEVRPPGHLVHVGGVGEVSLPVVCHETDAVLERRRRLGDAGLGEILGDMLTDQIYRNLVVRSSGDDDISKLLGWKTELLECRLDKLNVLVEHLVHVSTQLINISENSLGEATVSISVDKQFHVEHITNSGIVEGEDALEQDNIHLGREDGGELVDDARVGLEVISRDLGHATTDDVIQRLLHQFVVNSVRMIKVEESLVSSHLLTLLQLAVE